tara:strand:+ start:191 stop:544 length:354 start_codon:yes stop_codon:yes gene_type:complete
MLLFIPNAAADANRVWKKGDTIITSYVCRDQKSIMKIVEADTKSEEEVLAIMYVLTGLRHCAAIPMPLPFYVLDFLVDYTDFRKINTVVVSIAKITEPDIHVGYVLAEGTYKIDKGI